MADASRDFDYVAVDAGGRRVKGRIQAPDDLSAFERLKLDGLSPIHIKSGRGAAPRSQAPGPSLTERDAAGLLANLAALLKAGADMRAALSILGGRGGDKAARAFAQGLSGDIGGGEAVETAFTRHLPKNLGALAALIAAGQAAGDLPGGLQRAADTLATRIKLRDQIVSSLSYPAFVAVSTLAAVGVIFLFVVPSLAPLVEDAGGKAPAILSALIGISTAIRSNLVWIALDWGGVAAAFLIAYRAGMLRELVDSLVLDGPCARISRALIFGGFGVALGDTLAGGASMSEAMRLAVRSTRSGLARRRLERVAQGVREGEALSAALEAVRGFPPTIIRLAAVGEASGALGVMIARAGRLEEEEAIRRIEAITRILGPVMIVCLGGLIGLLMAGLLTGVSQLGEAALQ